MQLTHSPLELASALEKAGVSRERCVTIVETQIAAATERKLNRYRMKLADEENKVSRELARFVLNEETVQ